MDAPYWKKTLEKTRVSISWSLFLGLFNWGPYKNQKIAGTSTLRLKIPRIPLPTHIGFTSGLLRVHFRFTSGSLPVHFRFTIDGHMRCPIIQFFKKINFAKFADIHTYGHMEKKWLLKIPFAWFDRSGSKKSPPARLFHFLKNSFLLAYLEYLYKAFTNLVT